MNNTQIAKKNMYSKMKVFFTKAENMAIWALFMRLAGEIANFISRETELDKYIQKQQQKTTGITTEKKSKFTTMTKMVVKYARKARVWAVDTHNEELEAVFDIRVGDYTHIAEDLAYNQLKDVRDALNDNIGSLGDVNVKPADIVLIDAALLAYHDAEGTPGAAEAEKMVGTEGIDVNMEGIDRSLDIIDDLLINEYEESNPPLVENYRNNRKIDMVGIRHQGLNADISYLSSTASGGGPAEGITMRIVELNKTGVSDINGHVETLRGKVGTFHVEFSGDGIVTQTIVATIKKGTISTLTVKVVKTN